MALFQPMQQGPSGSAVTPKTEVQDTTVSSVLDFVGKAGTGLAGMFQDQAKSRSQQAVGTALTAFIDEQSRIAEAAEQGLDPAQARTRMRAAFNKHAANNPLLLDEFLKVQKAYAESQMGEAVTKGGVAYQEEQAKKIELQKQAAQDGFTDPDKWLIWEEQKRSWEKTNQANNEQLARLRAEATRASTDASRKAAALSQAKTEEIKIKESHNEAIFKDMAGNIDGAWKAAENVIHMPGTTEQKISQGERMIQQLKSRLVGTYNKADQARINTVLGNLDKLQEYMNDAIVQGKVTTALQNQINFLKDFRTVAMLGDGKTLNLMAASSIVGPGYLAMAPTQTVQVVQGLMNFTEKPSERKGPPAPMDAEGWAAMDKFLLGQSKAEQLPQYEVPVETVAEHQLVGALQSITLYGDGYASDDDVKGFLNMASGGGYELLKRSGPINIPLEVQAKYSQFLARVFEGVEADIKNEYASAVISSYKTVGGGIGQSVKTEQFQSATVIDPVVENGTFKFVAKIPEAKAEAERLNTRVTPVIMKLAKAVALGKGDDDLTKALKQLLPRVIEGEIPLDELEASGVKINKPVQQQGYGKRADGSDKGDGYFGELKRPDGDVSTELSIGVDYGSGEKEIPTLVPTLTKEEVDHLLSGGEPTDAITRKAVEFAVQREKEGKPVFAMPGEVYPSPTTKQPDYTSVAKEQGVDLSQYEDGTYEDGNGNTVVIKNGAVVEVR